MASWVAKLGGVEAFQAKALRKPRRSKRMLKPEGRGKALQAFWAMHVEAQIWSGLSAAEYASALGISPHSLREWRQRLDIEPLGVDWRELVHPSARPYVDPKISTSAKAEAGLTLTPRAMRDGDGRSNRRSFSEAQKRAMVAETEAPGATVSAVARRHGVVTSMLFRWRTQMGLGEGSGRT